jgi:hypothetical protein
LVNRLESAALNEALALGEGMGSVSERAEVYQWSVNHLIIMTFDRARAKLAFVPERRGD